MISKFLHAKSVRICIIGLENITTPGSRAEASSICAASWCVVIFMKVSHPVVELKAMTQQVLCRYGRQIPFAYLINIKDEFTGKFASRAKGATENSLDKTFG